MSIKPGVLIGVFTRPAVVSPTGNLGFQAQTRGIFRSVLIQCFMMEGK
jgi:hypothetical protein